MLSDLCCWLLAAAAVQDIREDAKGLLDLAYGVEVKGDDSAAVAP